LCSGSSRQPDDIPSSLQSSPPVSAPGHSGRNKPVSTTRDGTPPGLSSSPPPRHADQS
jgi:hypothetical protein